MRMSFFMVIFTKFLSNMRKKATYYDSLLDDQIKFLFDDESFVLFSVHLL